MYEYENNDTNQGTQSSVNGEYRYSGPFYTDNYSESYRSGSYDSSNYSSNSYSSGSLGKGKKKKKTGGFGKTLVKAICIGLVFGIAASAAFQTTNYIGRKTLGEEVTVDNSANTITILPKVETSEVVSNNNGSGTADVSTVVDNCMASLVAITNVSIAEVPNYWGFWGGGRTQQQEQISAGTGIIIGMNDTELLIVTNNHVTEGAKTLTVVFSVDEDKDEPEAVEARIKGADATKDLSVISVKLTDIPDETLSSVKIATIGDSSSLKVGQQVVAIGNALGYGQSVTSGVISALGREVTLQNSDGSYITNNLIQTDAAINGGNSGGALLNMQGEVIGINEAKYSSAEGMGYAIPITDVEAIISDLSLRTTRDKVDERNMGYLGITCQDVTADVSQQFDMPKGIYVSSVNAGSGAEKAGIQKGDIITKFDRVTISTYEELKEQLSYYSAGETVEIVVQSPNGADYVEKTLQVTLSARADIE